MFRRLVARLGDRVALRWWKNAGTRAARRGLCATVWMRRWIRQMPQRKASERARRPTWTAAQPPARPAAPTGLSTPICGCGPLRYCDARECRRCLPAPGSVQAPCQNLADPPTLVTGRCRRCATHVRHPAWLSRRLFPDRRGRRRHRPQAPARPASAGCRSLQTLAAMLRTARADRITAALAARLDVSKRALYRHFASKAQMFEGLISSSKAACSLVGTRSPSAANRARTGQRIALMLLQFGEKNPGMTRRDGGRRAGVRARTPDRAHEPVLRPRQVAAAPVLAPGGRSQRLAHAHGRRTPWPSAMTALVGGRLRALRPFGLQAPAHRRRGSCRCAPVGLTRGGVARAGRRIPVHDRTAVRW